jgi:hypothetical protein
MWSRLEESLLARNARLLIVPGESECDDGKLQLDGMSGQLPQDGRRRRRAAHRHEGTCLGGVPAQSVNQIRGNSTPVR